MYDLWEIDDYNCIIDGTTKALLFTVNASNGDDLLPIMRKIAAAPAMYEALQEIDAQLDPLTVKAQEELGLRQALIKVRAALAHYCVK